MFVTEKPAIFAALSIAKDAVDGKSKIPLLTHVLFDRDGDRMTITGTDLNQEICARFDAEIGRDFEAFACPAQLLVDVIKALSDGLDIRFEAVRSAGRFNDIRIRAGSFQTKLPILDAKDFPVLPQTELPFQMSLNAPAFAKALKTVAFAAETNEQRPANCGVRLDPDEDGLSVVATNTNRLARRFLPAIEFDDDLAGIPAVTVPNAAVQAIVRLLDKQEDVTIDLSTHCIRVSSGDVVLTSKLIDERFLAYKGLRPSPNAVTATLSAQALSAALARVLAVNSDKMSGVVFDFGVNRLVLNSRDDANGEADDEIAISCSGEIRQGYNGRFVIAALEHLDRDEIEISIGDARNPAFIRSVGDDRTVMMIGVMSMRGVAANSQPEGEAA
ncbi:DNA polymerase III subunit beta [Rhizobium sp. 768_B6_N1_8]|uniref:DNA polymerase III subunit beta n=1 Tax=unclassified Rhizobium TaxID=2613769 RepID=UPI003F2566C4